jgi:RNA polymerase subunit RPABC4/transcription elongation factor Spt4
MSNDGERKERKLLPKRDSLLGMFKSKGNEQPEAEAVAVKEEKKRVKRVVKTKPMSREHMSESMETPRVSDEDLKITAAVMQGIGTAPGQSAPTKASEPGFACLECGAPVPNTSERCPRCNTLYVRNFKDEDLAALESVDDEFTVSMENSISKGEVPCMHFNAESGTINYLENDTKAPDFEVECSHCGTLIGFDAERCPICGTKFELADTGLVSLFHDMEFDKECTGNIACPLCGERVELNRGRCPSCGETVCEDNPRDPDRNVAPVIHNENVVFLHLDVESGEVNYLQRLARKLGFEQLTVKLDGIGKGGFDREIDWKSLSRI